MIEQLSVYWDFLLAQIIPRFVSFIEAPIHDTDMLYTVVPLLASLTLMEIYFGRNKTEELGWNTAFGNTVALFFVMANLVRYLLSKYPVDALINDAVPSYKLTLVGILSLEAAILIYFNYYHMLPKNLAFLISSSLPVNVTAFLTTVMVMGNFPFDFVTLQAAIMTFLVFWVAYALLQLTIEPSEEAKIEITKKKQENAEYRQRIWMNIKMRVISFKDRMLSYWRPPGQ